MCATCGCSTDAGPRVTIPGLRNGHHDDHHHDNHGHGLLGDHGDHGDHGDSAHEHEHSHHEHEQQEPSTSDDGRMVLLEQEVLAKNDRGAARNRELLAAQGILAMNLMSSPGAGKTTLLQRTIHDLGPTAEVSVIEGDQETLVDAERIRATGAPVVQINTGSGCHLDADMVAAGLRTLRPAPNSVLFIENVGNLVCPALFDLGERHRVVIVSTTEGADKPLKYPHMFRSADLVLLNKVDLLPYLTFDVDEFDAAVRQVNRSVEILSLSATRGDGLDEWLSWLRAASATVSSPAKRSG